MLPVALASANAAQPAPASADIVITYASQSFAFSGRLRYFDVSESGGRLGFDVRALGTPDYSPRPDIGNADLRMPGNHWQVVGFAGRFPLTIEGTCAVESFATAEGDATVQHIFLNCVDLDVSG